jgi:hypothetical protein
MSGAVNEGALALLDGAAEVLRATAPGLAPDARYATLLCASAIATGRRDAATAARSEGLGAAVGGLRDAIRAGAHDGDAALHARLLAWAALRAWVADPDALTPRERAALDDVAE